MQVNWPFVELGFGQDSLLHQLEEELAHVVPCYLTALQGWLHPDVHKYVELRAQVKLVHTLDSLLHKTNEHYQDCVAWKPETGVTLNTTCVCISGYYWLLLQYSTHYRQNQRFLCRCLCSLSCGAKRAVAVCDAVQSPCPDVISKLQSAETDDHQMTLKNGIEPFCRPE